jgi:hypothetical protein
MVIKFLEGIAGPNFDFRIQEIADLPESIARPWVDSGIAVEVEQELKDENRLVVPRETAALPRTNRPNSARR